MAIERQGPGKIIGTRGYTGKVISIDIDTVRFPDGSTGQLEMVRHPGASAVVPLLGELDDDPEVLLIRQYRYAAEGYLYEIPAGRLDAGEEPLACAHRELKEETGYTASRVEHLFTMYTTPGFTDEKIHLFMATGLEAGEWKREADEFMELAPTKLSRALSMIEQGEIQEVKSGQLKAIAVGSAKRVPSLADIPTISESGLPGYEAYSWVGIVAPAKTPKEIVTRLNREIVDILKLPDVAEKLNQQGALPVGDTPEQFASYIKDEIAKWGAVVRSANIKAD